MRRFSLRILYLAVLIGCAGLGSCTQRSHEPEPRVAGGNPFVVDVVTVAPVAFCETLFATGSLLARESIILQAERAGIVQEIRFTEGKPVKAGEVLAVLDDSELQAQLARAGAQLELAAALEARDRELFETGNLISAVDYERTRANLAIARAEKQLMEAQLAKTRIVAPFDGVAGLRQISPGAYVTPGTALATLQDISSLRLDFSLPERYLEYLRMGQKVIFAVAGRGGEFEATIAAIEPAIDVASRSLQVRAITPNEGRRLPPGAFAEVRVELDEIPDAILIPAIALVPGLKQQTVFVHQNGLVEERLVQAGLRTTDAVQIVDGLAPGEEVAASGVLLLRPGMRVQARPIPGPAAPEQKRGLEAQEAEDLPGAAAAMTGGGPRQ